MRMTDEPVIVEMVASRAGVADFIRLPATLYQGLPGYAPALEMDERMLLDPRQSPMWKRAQVCYFLARQGGRIVGRISAQLDERVPAGLAPGAGMFGCLDAIDSRAVVAALIGAAEGWLREQGCLFAFGPCMLDMNEQPGLLVSGGERERLIQCPWHPPYLATHLEALGYATLRNLLNWRLELGGQEIAGLAQARRLAERMPGLVMRSPTRRSLSRDLAQMCAIYNEGWADNWGFVPLLPEELAGLREFLFWFLHRAVFRIVELDGEPVATVLTIPNLFELTEGLAPRPGVAGWLRFAMRMARQRFRGHRIILMGVSTRLRHTPVGAALSVLLVDEIIRSQSHHRGEWVEAGWVLEDNLALVTILEKFGFRPSRTFRLFGRPLALSSSTKPEEITA